MEGTQVPRRDRPRPHARSAEPPGCPQCGSEKLELSAGSRNQGDPVDRGVCRDCGLKWSRQRS